MKKFSPKLTKLGEYWCTKRLKNQASWNPYPEDQSWGATSWSCWQWYHCPHWRHQQADQQCSRPGLWQAFPVFHWGRKSPSMGSLYWCRPCAILWLHPGKEDIYKRITACNWMPSYACKIILYLIYIHFSYNISSKHTEKRHFDNTKTCWLLFCTMRCVIVWLPSDMTWAHFSIKIIKSPDYYPFSPLFLCFFNLNSLNLSLDIFTCLKSMVKAPRYATVADDRRTSPVMLVTLSPSRRAASVHLSFSPPSPPISFSALSNFFSQISMFVSSSFFFCVIASNSSFKACNLSVTY